MWAPDDVGYRDFGNADLGIEVILLDSGISVALEGELDLATAPALREQLSELVAMGWFDITLDLAELQYIDSTGLSLLIRTQKRVEQTGGSLIVVHPTRATRSFSIPPDLRRSSWVLGALRSDPV